MHEFLGNGFMFKRINQLKSKYMKERQIAKYAVKKGCLKNYTRYVADVLVC